MTTLASNNIPPQTNAPNQSTSSTSARPPTPTSSGQSDTKIAAVPAGSRSQSTSISYAAATKKFSSTPPIVSSTASPSLPVVGGATGPNARNTTASPVNGKPQVPPAVPTVAPPVSGNVIVNGASSPANNHSRKSSIAGGNAWMQNGSPHGMPPRPQQANAGAPIQFGSFPGNHTGPPPPGNAAVSSPNLSAPAVPNPRVSSPQTSPSPLPQPAASGGPLQSAGMRGQNITFGSLDTNVPDSNRPASHNRPAPMPIPPVAPAAQVPAHTRRDSNSHSGHPDMQQGGMGPGRVGMPPRNDTRRGGNSSYTGQYPPQGQQYNNNYNNNYNKHAPSHPRGNAAGMNNGGHYQNPGQMGGYPGSPRPARSPAIHHSVPLSLPATPQMNTVPMANSPSFQPAHLYPAPTHVKSPNPPFPLDIHSAASYPFIPEYEAAIWPVLIEQYPHTTCAGHDLTSPQFMSQNQYDPQQFYAGYPPHQMYAQQGYNIPPQSPRTNYQQMAQPGVSPYMPSHYQIPPPMSRSSSQAAAPEIHRPPSVIGIQHPSMTPPAIPQQPPTPGTPGLNSSIFSKRESKKVVIRNPHTNHQMNFRGPEPAAAQTTPPTQTPVPPAQTQSTPPIVTSSGPVIVQSAPSPSPSEGAKQKTAEEKRLEMQELVRKKKESLEREEKERKEREEREERERKEKEAEEERLKKEEEERKQKEEEERIRKEAEEKARLEEEERKRKEAEEAEAARIAKEKAEAEEAARIAKEKEEEERRLKEEEEKRAKEEALKLEEEAKAKAEAEAAAAAAAAKAAEESSKATEEQPVPTIVPPKGLDDGMPPPSKPVEKKAKPQPLVLQTKTATDPGMPSAALTALRSARFIDDINSVSYPSNILSPNPGLNPSAPSGKFKYGKDFLLQFQGVFTEKPSVDWDQRIRETVGEPSESARPMTARQPSNMTRQGSRTGFPASTGIPPMGAFGSGKGLLNPGMMTSAQRFEQSNKPASSSFPSVVGNFRPGPPALSRTNSSPGLAQQSPIPQSPRSGNRSQRGSKRGGGPGGVAMEKTESRQSDPKQNFTIPPSEVKPLVVSETRWQPPRKQAPNEPTPAAAAAAEDDKLSPDLVQRKVKAALNKMTPEKFDKISGQILDIASQSKSESDGRTLRQVIQLTFEKATDEAAWSSMYAKFCKRMLESMDPNIKDESIRDKNGKVVTGGNLFRKYLLNRCQEEFERGWKVNLPPKPEGLTDEAAMLSDEYYVAAAAKRRGLGLIIFIGELFKLGMLTERIMHECVKKLVDYEGIPEEEEVESLCKLLKTIGRSLDSTEKSRPMVDIYFARIEKMMSHPDLPSRIRFMLMDICDLRKKGWESKEIDKGPKTIAEIREDAQRAQQEKEAASRAAQQQQRNRPMGRGDGRSFSQGYGHQQEQRISQNTLNNDDLRKLQQKNRNVSSGQSSSFGPPSMFASARSNSSKGSKLGLGFNRDDSGASSRTGTPPAGAQRESTNSRNPFGILADQTSPPHEGDTESPSASAASSPPTSKAKLDDRMRSIFPKSDSKA